MPRRSTASLSLLTSRNPEATRLRPPAWLPEPERRVFAELVADSAPTHFRASDLPVLCAYVEATVLSRQAMQQMREASAVVSGKPSPWLTVREKATPEIFSLSLRLRLSPQARATNN